MCEAIEGIRNEGKAEGIEEGKAEGKLEMLIELVRDSVLSVKDAAARAGMSVDEFEEKMAVNA